MEELDLFRRIGLALAIGLMVGIERGWQARTDSEGSRVAGIRTFTLLGLAGGATGALSSVIGDVFASFALLAVTALVIVAYVIRSWEHRDYGITTEVAALATFLLGIWAVRGDMTAAAASGVVMTAVLAIKGRLHSGLRLVDRHEIEAAIQFLVISVVLLPVLPDEGYGPGEALNPYLLWWVVVLLCGLSFAGYLAIRIAGPRRGVLATALLGGIVSSTAVTVSLSRRARGTPDLAGLMAKGIVLAAATMFLRVLVVVGVLNAALLPLLAWPMLFMSITGFAMAFLLRSARSQSAEPQATTRLVNPLELGTAVKYAALIALVVVLTEVTRTQLGDAGLYALAAIAGLTDVDAITVSMARISSSEITAETATIAIAIAAFVNTAVKGAITVIFGDRALARRVVPAIVAIIAAGAAGLALA